MTKFILPLWVRIIGFFVIACNSLDFSNFIAIKKVFQQNIEAKYPDRCSSEITKLNNLLVLLCNNTQSNTTIRAACVACFAATTANQMNPRLLTNLSACARVYLNNTGYQSCATVLMTAASSSSQSSLLTNCPIGYCGFVQCIRRINANNLISSCYSQTLPGNNVSTAAGQLNHYVNATSCILARARCSPFNPITGVPQRTPGAGIYNALQISSNRDLRILAFPASIRSAAFFCSNAPDLTSQASYLTFNC